MSKKKKKKNSNKTVDTLSQKKAERLSQEKKIRIRNIIVTSIISILGLVVVAVGLVLLFNKEHAASQTVVFKINNEKVYKDEINLCILQNAVSLKIDEEKLSVPEEKLKSLGVSSADEYYKKEIIDMILDYKVESKMATKQGLKLSDDEKSQVKSDVTQYLSVVNSRVLNELGITKQCIVDVYEQRMLASKLVKKTTEDIKVEDADIDKRFATIYVMLFPKVETTNDGDYVREDDGETPVMLSDEKIKEQKEKADAAYKELVEDGVDVESVAKKYGVEVFSGQQSNLIDSFDEPFADAAKKLKEGEYSNVLDIESCYGIVKLIKENNEQLSEQIMKQYKEDNINEELSKIKDEWYSDLSIDKEPHFVGNEWDKITFYDFIKYVDSSKTDNSEINDITESSVNTK